MQPVSVNDLLAFALKGHLDYVAYELIRSDAPLDHWARHVHDVLRRYRRDLKQRDAVATGAVLRTVADRLRDYYREQIAEIERKAIAKIDAGKPQVFYPDKNPRR